MTKHFRVLAGVAVALLVLRGAPLAQAPALPAPGFHHLHLNSLNPSAAIEFYAKQFPSTSADTFAGHPALKSPNNVWILFNRVATPPATQPPTAFWHFGWHVTDVRQSLELYKRNAVTLLPLYTGDAGGTVFISSDTFPGTGGGIGLTLKGIAEAKAKGVKPSGGAGFAYLRGPDDALVEYQGNMAAERFNHVHMFQDQPYCAQIWYETHLNVPRGARGGDSGRTASNCSVERSPDRTFPALESDGTYRTPSINSTRFGDVSLFWYMNQGNRPAASTRGHLMDHVALTVSDLDAWLAKLTAEGVTILERPYTLGTFRAMMIEGPSREAIELIEIR